MPPKTIPKNTQTAKSKQAARRKTPSKRKQPISTQDRLKRLFSTLSSQIDASHFVNAIKTCDKILRIGPDDEDALKTKLFLLLQTERYNDALSLLDTLHGKENASFGFEKAYTLYRLQKEHQAQELLDSLPEKENHRGIVHLEAQLNYRQGSYEASIDLYNQLLDTADANSEEYSDILTNLQASQQHLDFIQSGYLRALDTLPASLISSLESSAPPSIAQTIPSVHLQTTTTTSSTQGPQQQPVKKVRMRRVPAGVVPGVTPPPDPERWLKKSERSNYGMAGAGGGKKHRKAAYGSGATQGSVETSIVQASSASVSTGATTASGKSGKPKKKK